MIVNKPNKQTTHKPKTFHEYLVTWTIELNASDPQQAAIKALEIQQDPTSIALQFNVRDTSTGEIHSIDLLKNYGG